jgi:hypothetical protein
MLRGARKTDTTNSNLVAYLCAVVLLAVVVPAAAVIAESPQPETANGVPEATHETEMPGRELAETSWRLVKIMGSRD